MLLVAFALLSCQIAYGQGPGVSGPAPAYVFDPVSLAVRPFVGVPGAAYAASPLLRGVEFASISPRGAAAIITRENRTHFVSGLNVSAPVWRELRAAKPDIVAWSPSQERAAVWLAKEGMVQIADCDSTTLQPWSGDLLSLAIDEDTVFLGSPDGLYGLSAAGVQRIAGPVRPTALVPGKNGTVFAFDGEERQFWRVGGEAGHRQAAPFARYPEYRVTAMAYLPARDSLLIATAQQVLLLHTGSGSNEVIPVDSPVTLLQPLRPDLFLLSAPSGSGEPFHVLELTATPTAWFVPVDRRND